MDWACARMGHLATTCRCKDMDCRNCGKKCQSKKNTGKIFKAENKQEYRKEKKKRPVHTMRQQEELSSESTEASQN